jgi:phosphatidylserine/phosphatidylglycerophosphate/cardiolipin synthase-like enzyme
MKPLVHYTSGELRLRIRKLFEIPKAAGRRVVIVAYIGVDYATFLPNPKGTEIVCSPTPGATSAEAVQKLIEAGARVWFSDRLHMKVYFAQKIGCLITSANLSDNALGMNGLKEMGILVRCGHGRHRSFTEGGEAVPG